MKTKRIILLMLALMLTLGIPVCAAAEAPRSVDVIMILDCSGSMLQNDPNKLMGKAAMNFVDMCDVSGTRVAIVPYSYRDKQQGNVRNFQDVSVLSVRESLRSLLTHLSYLGGTDTGAAFEKAKAFYLNRGETNNRAIVLFFSDGVIDLSDPADSSASTQKVKDAVAFFAQEQVPIYCLGLQGTFPFDRDMLNDIAEQTGTGYARVVTASNNASLYETFSEIMVEYLGTAPLPLGSELPSDTNQRTYTIHIPNESILEANINLRIVNPRANAQFRNVTLYDPNNNLVEPLSYGTPQPGDVIMGNSLAYFNIKMIRPRMGDWKLTYNWQELDQVDAKMISNYDIGIRFVTDQQPKKNQPLPIKAEFYSLSGEAYSDQYLYDTRLIDRLIVTRNGEAINNITFTADPQAYNFHTTLDSLAVGDYSIELFINGDGILCSTVPFTFTVENHAPQFIGEDPKPYDMGVNGLLYRPTNDTLVLPLRNWFVDEDGDPLTYAFRRSDLPPQAVNTSVDGEGNLTVRFSDVASGSLTVVASDGITEAARPLLLTFNVRSLASQVYTELGFGALAVIVLLIVALLVYRATRPRFGRLACLEVQYAGIEFSTAPVSQINLARYDVHTVSIYSILEDAGSTGSNAVTSTQHELGSILLKPLHKNAIKVLNNMADGTQITVEVNGMLLDHRRSTSINVGATFSLRFALENRYIIMTYQNEIVPADDDPY